MPPRGDQKISLDKRFLGKIDLAKKINLSLLSTSEKELLGLLVKWGQSHLFDNWVAGGNFELKRGMLSQLAKLDESIPDGLKGYLKTAKSLLERVKSNKPLLEGWAPIPPTVQSLSFGTESFVKLERVGVEAMLECAFVLVAGGLGERLGYPGIKLAIKSELCTEETFLGLYIKSILALQKRALEMKRKKKIASSCSSIQLTVMTSDETDSATKGLLKANNWFGMTPAQITIIKQRQVPCLKDFNARLAKYGDHSVLTKPHGHGDVHPLLRDSKVLSRWPCLGVKWVIFFQDTNPLVFKAVPALVGAMVAEGHQMEFLAVSRRPGEPTGALCALRPDGRFSESTTSVESNHKHKGVVTCSVEYNQFEDLLVASGRHELAHDISFPANTNVFALDLDCYREAVEKEGFRVPEFINPKLHSDRKGFLTPSRVECLMQDIAWALPGGTKVGCTLMDRWMCFSAAKNSLAGALRKQAATGFPESIASAEADLYRANCEYLRYAGAKVLRREAKGAKDAKHSKVSKGVKGVKGVNDSKDVKSVNDSKGVKGAKDAIRANKSHKRVFHGVETEQGPLIVISPEFASSYGELLERVKGVEMTDRSALLLLGADCSVHNVRLDGCLVVQSQGVTVHDLAVSNEGWELLEVEKGVGEAGDEDERARGHRLVKRGQLVV